MMPPDKVSQDLNLEDSKESNIFTRVRNVMGKEVSKEERIKPVRFSVFSAKESMSTLSPRLIFLRITRHKQKYRNI
jgi:hypothetical protein